MLALVLVGCGGENQSTTTVSQPAVKEVVQEDIVESDTTKTEEIADNEAVTDTTAKPKKVVSQMSEKDRLENEKFRLAELERRRQLAMQANPGLILPKPQPTPVASAPEKVVQKAATPNTKPATSKQSTVKKIETTASKASETTKPVKEKVVSTPVKETPVVSTPPVVKEEPKPAAPVSTPAKTGKAEITFDQKRFAFDTIVEGDIINHKFRFVNTGERPIEILNAKASCGCTMPSFPFLTIEPGEEGFIGVTYNSRTKEGKQTPEIEVLTNYQKEPVMLYLDGYVKEKEKAETKSEIEDQGK